MTNETNKTNDYNLLRAFNLEQAQAGAGILLHTSANNTVDVLYVGVTKDQKNIAVEFGKYCCSYCTETIKMKPLAWVDGKPVYKGDVLYYTYQDGSFDVVTVTPVMVYSNTVAWSGLNELTWTKPKKKHIHQELKDAHKAGAKIQCFNTNNVWMDITWEPNWEREFKYRIKPQEKSGWINLWKSNKDNLVTLGSNVFETKELAELMVKDRDDLTQLAIIEIHWEE
jgi:hypothetical protein